MECNYNEDKLNGDYKLYNNKGELVKKCKYADGVEFDVEINIK